MTLTPTRRRCTVHEYYRMAETGVPTEDDHVELIDGEIIIAPLAFPERELDGVDLLG